MLHSVLPTLLATVLSAGSAAAEEPLFPFVISYDAPDNATNVSSWLHRSVGEAGSAAQPEPAGEFGPVRVEKRHLATAAGLIRFWATNICFDACFPTHDEAEKLAARLARLGINCVRMHHMDSHAIWGDNPNHLTLDPKGWSDWIISSIISNGKESAYEFEPPRVAVVRRGGRFRRPAESPRIRQGAG